MKEKIDDRDRLVGVAGSEYIETRFMNPDHRLESLALPGVVGRVEGPLWLLAELGLGLDAAVRKGLDMVVTNIDCLRRDFSGTDASEGRKLRIQSKGLWDESEGGSLGSEDPILGRDMERNRWSLECVVDDDERFSEDD